MSVFFKNIRQYGAAALLVSTIGLLTTFNKFYLEIHLLTLCWAAYLGIAAQILLFSKSPNPLPGDRISKLMLLYITFLIIIYFFSTTRFYSFFSTWEALVLPMTFLLWRMLLSQKQNSWGIGWNIILILGVFFAIWGLSDLRNPQAVWISGPRIEPNAFADMMLVVLVPATMIYLTGLHKATWSQHRLYEMSIALMAVALLLTDSRAAILIWCVLTILILIFAFRHKLIYFPRLLKLTVVYVLAFCIYLVIEPGDQYNYSSLISEGSSTADWSVRFSMWQSALDIYQIAPLTGTGLGSFRINYSAFRSPDEMTTSGMMAHNDYIQMLVEGGPLLLGFMLVFVGIVGYYLVRSLLLSPTKSKPASEVAINFSLLLALLGLATHALINFSLILPVFGAYFGIYLAQATHNDEPKQMNINRKSKIFIISIAVALWLLLATDTLFKDSFKRDNTTYLSTFNLDNQLKVANLASIIRPKNMDVHYYIIDRLQKSYRNSEQPAIRKKLKKHIIDEFHLLMSSCTACADPHLNLGKFFLATEQLEKAEEQMLLAVKKQPTFIPNYINLAKVLGLTGQYDKAITLLMNDAQPWLAYSSAHYNTRHDIPLFQAALHLANEHGNSLEKRVIADYLLQADPGNALAIETLNTLTSPALKEI